MALRKEIKQILRTLMCSKLLTSINVLGLGIGLGSVILLTTFVIHEFSFDQHISKSSRIYRVVSNNSCGSYYAMGEAIISNIPEIENVCRITDVASVWTVIMDHENQNYPIESFIAADPSILDMLDIEVQQRQTDELLTSKSVLISENVAKKYFGNEDPVGRSIAFSISKSKQLLQVAGVYKDFPSYSSFQADFICDISIAFGQFEDLEVTVGVRKEKRSFNFFTQWERHNSFTTFVLLQQKTDAATVQQKCFDVCQKHLSSLKEIDFKLQPFNEMYLHSEGLAMIEPLKKSQFKSLKIFLSIGILILIVACLNYILISSSEQRSSIIDIACRKINGASDKQIIRKVMLKSFIVAFASLVPACLFVLFSLPIFNSYFHEELNITVLLGWQYLGALIIITSITAVLAGLYLSIVALKASPIDLLRKSIGSINSKWRLSNYLVMTQFIVFTLLLSSMLIMRKQIDYSLEKDLGFSSKNIMAIELGSNNLKTQYTSICNEILQLPNIVSCQPTTVCFPTSDNVFIYEYNDKETNQGVQQEIILLAPGNLEFFDIQLLDGVTFNESNSQNRNNFLINEAASKKYGVEAGGKISGFNILGVVEDFHLKSIHSPITPMFIAPQTSNYPYLIAKTDGNDTNVPSQINRIIQKVDPGYYFKPEVLSDKVEAFYKKDKQQTKIVSFFSFVALTLSFMGLFGFVNLALSSRIKEIGVRKINGAKTSEILALLNKDFIKWVMIAFVVACPIAYYAMSKWLENFAYKTELSWWIFALAGLIALGIALITVSWQSWRAATRNPVEALRYE